jgi:hypothetical protein
VLWISLSVVASPVQVQGGAPLTGVHEQPDDCCISIIDLPYVRPVSLSRGLSTSLTIPLRFSTLISARQQILPSFSHVIKANLSPGRMPASSRTSFGSTICPRSSTVSTDSTRQPPVTPQVHAGSHSFFFVMVVLSAVVFLFIYIFQKNQKNLKMHIYRNAYFYCPAFIPMSRRIR